MRCSAFKLTTLELFDPADTSPSPSIAPWDNSESYKLIIESKRILLEINSRKTGGNKKPKA